VGVLPPRKNEGGGGGVSFFQTLKREGVTDETLDDLEKRGKNDRQQDAYGPLR